MVTAYCIVHVSHAGRSDFRMMYSCVILEGWLAVVPELFHTLVRTLPLFDVGFDFLQIVLCLSPFLLPIFRQFNN